MVKTILDDTPIKITPSAADSRAGSSYDTLYAQLNTPQKLAVETIEGPVMVLAGAGTGKTQVLTLRIANILRQTHMNPRNVLALTFTDHAAQNMRQRLISMIGPLAYGVAIHTFHGFANLIITEFPYKFAFAKELQSIDQVEQIEIIERLIDQLPLEELRPPRAPHHYLREVMSRISDLKKENVLPADLEKIVAAEKERLEKEPASFHEKGAYKGKMKAAVVEELKQLARCQELAAVYAGYQQKLQETGHYDYDDMVLFVVRQLEEDSELKAYYQERFQYVLVDEYQDTNNSQNRLIELLTDFFELPNLFVVGDDKQSIFRFQGASMANLLRFYQRYPTMKVINLTDNYRSSQAILDVAHRVIALAAERITQHIEGITDELRAAVKSELTEPAVSQGTFSNPDVEYFWIVEKIKQLIKEGIAPDQIAIIYKENREAEAFADLLGRSNIAYSLERGSNVLLDLDVRRLLTMLRAIAGPTDSRSLFEYLHYDFTGLRGTDLLKLMAYRAKNRLSLIESLSPLPCDCTRHKDLAKEGATVHFDDCQRLEAVYEQLGMWRIATANLSLPEFVEQVLNESGLLRQITESPARVERLHRLHRFFDEVKRLALRTPDLDLQKLLNHSDLLTANNIQLVPEPIEFSSTTGSVRLMTAHKAKGLEFQHVFLPNLIDKHWGNATRRSLIKLPISIVGSRSVAEEEKNEDDRRLFYVALTRAKDSLYLTSARAKDGKELLPSLFVTELITENDSPAIDQITTGQTEASAGAHLLALFAPMADSQFNGQEAAYLRQIITEQPLTPTGLNNYLRCPKGYLYKNLLRIPTAKTAQQGYGTAIHAAMQAFFLLHRATQHVPTLEDLLAAFTQTLGKEIMSPTELADFLRVGTRTLTAYFEKNLRAVVPTVAVEYSFDPHHVILETAAGPIWLTGRLDKLELIDAPTNKVRVVDYKTGRARSRNEIEGKTARADEDYKRQLIFYQLLAESDRQFPYKVAETALAFVDDDGRFPIERFTITKEEVADLKGLIGHVYKQMLSLEFPHFEDPSRPSCEFCSI